MTRARDTLILTATVSENRWKSHWLKPEAITPQTVVAAKSYADWLGMWFGVQNMTGSAGLVPANFRQKRQHAGKMPALPARGKMNCRICDGGLKMMKLQAKNWKPEIENRKLPSLRWTSDGGKVARNVAMGISNSTPQPGARPNLR